MILFYYIQYMTHFQYIFIYLPVKLPFKKSGPQIKMPYYIKQSINSV